MDVIIRRALSAESDILTELAIASNHYWGYPEQYYKVWDRELQMDPSHIGKNMVYLTEKNGDIVGYFSIVEISFDCRLGCRFVNKGHWLENLFVAPNYIGKGIGAFLVKYAKLLCREMGIKKLHIFIEPLSQGFYEKMGGQYVRESPTEFAGRFIPVYELPIRESAE